VTNTYSVRKKLPESDFITARRQHPEKTTVIKSKLDRIKF